MKQSGLDNCSSWNNLYLHRLQKKITKSTRNKIIAYYKVPSRTEGIECRFGVNNILKRTLKRNVKLHLWPSCVGAGDFLQA